MKSLLLYLAVFLLFQASTTAEIGTGKRLGLIGLDSGLANKITNGIGTDFQWLPSRVTLSSAYIVLQDADCNNTYGVCKKFCNQADFCRIYCNPICCTSEEQRIEFCSQIQAADYHPYRQNSTKFRITGPYFRSESGDGIWAEDVLWLDQWMPKNVGTVPIALQVVNKRFSAQSLNALFGLGRQSKTNSIVHVLHRGGYISDAVVTIAYIDSLLRFYILGEHNEQFCRRDRQTVSVVGDLHWMFDAKQAAFLNHKTEVHDFRILLETDSITMMPREVLNSFLESGIIAPDFTRYPKERNLFKINPKHRNDTFEFFFKLNDGLTLYSDLESIDVDKYYPPETGLPILFKAAALDPNPDRVEWMIGRVVLTKYCAFLDYNQNKIGFSKIGKTP